jgi:hypothetical protein
MPEPLPRAPQLGRQRAEPIDVETEAPRRRFEDEMKVLSRRVINARVPMRFREVYLLAGKPFQDELHQLCNNMGSEVAAANARLANSQAAVGTHRAVQVSHASLDAGKVGNTACVPISPVPLLYVPGIINEHTCLLTLDAGAQFNVMTLAAAYSLQVVRDLDSSISFRGIDEELQRSLGTAQCNVQLGTGNDGIITNQQFILVDDKDKHGYTILMGLPFLEAVGGALDIKNNRFTVQKDERTLVSYPLNRRSHRGKVALLSSESGEHGSFPDTEWVDHATGSMNMSEELDYLALDDALERCMTGLC